MVKMQIAKVNNITILQKRLFKKKIDTWLEILIHENVKKTPEREGLEPTSTKCNSLANCPIDHSSIFPSQSWESNPDLPTYKVGALPTMLLWQDTKRIELLQLLCKRSTLTTELSVLKIREI